MATIFMLLPFLYGVTIICGVSTDQWSWEPGPDTTLVDLAQEEGETELVDLINLASIGQPLSAAGSMTLFGPTNSAFQKLSPDVMKMLRTNQTLLVDTLLYHVLRDELKMNDTYNDMTVNTLNGNSVRINVYDIWVNHRLNGTVTTVSGKAVGSHDLVANNGLLHEIDGVMFPPSGTIYELVSKSPDHTILTRGIQMIGLTDILEGDGPLTMFAPTDKAFNSLPGDTLKKLLSNVTAFEDVVAYHICPGTYFTAGFRSMRFGVQYLRTLSSSMLIVNTTETYSTVNSIKIPYPDINVSNGVVHGMETVLLPGRAPPSSMKANELVSSLPRSSQKK